MLPHITPAHRDLIEQHVFEDVMQLVDLVREGTPTPVTAEAARHVIEIIEAAYRAAATGATQTLTTTVEGATMDHQHSDRIRRLRLHGPDGAHPQHLSTRQEELVALAEPRAALLGQVADRYGVARRYASHRGLADDPEVEAVMVSGHYSGQGEIAAELLAAGKHVLVEKPMATTVEQAERMLRAEAGAAMRA